MEHKPVVEGRIYMNFSMHLLQKGEQRCALMLSLLVAYVLRIQIDGLLPLVVIGMGLLLHHLWRHPHNGFIVLLCLVYALPAVPQLQDAPTWAFVSAAVIWSIACVREWWQKGGGALAGWQSKALLAALVLLVINFIVAQRNGIELFVWLRSAAALLPLALILPALLLRQPEEDASWKWIALTVGLISLSLAAEALWTYMYHQLWDKVALDSPVAQAFFATPMGQYFLEFSQVMHYGEPIYLRIASIIPETQGILIPAGAVVWFAASVALPKRSWRWMAIIAATICFCAVSATLTRSMLLSVVLVQGIISIYYLSLRSYRHRLIGKALFQGSIVLFFVLYFNIFQSFTVRTYALLNEWREYAIVRMLLPAQFEMAPLMSANAYRPETSYRLQEIEQVAYLFYDAPILGNGLGTSIIIDMPVRTVKAESYRPRFVHNWVLYWLMVGGITGTLLFAAYLFAPLANLRRLNVPEHEMLRYAVISLTLILIIYGLFFAVCVTPPYTLLMAVLMDFTLQQYRQANRNE